MLIYIFQNCYSYYYHNTLVLLWFRLPPWANQWLLGAILVSMLLHCFILYVPWAALLFSVEPLDAEAWLAVLCLSFPVIVIDELLKVATR